MYAGGDGSSFEQGRGRRNAVEWSSHRTRFLILDEDGRQLVICATKPYQNSTDAGISEQQLLSWAASLYLQQQLKCVYAEHRLTPRLAALVYLGKEFSASV
jgi:hypothetical protein